jgi:hypothetical protein
MYTHFATLAVTAAGTNQNFYIKDFQNQVAMRGVARHPPFRPGHSFVNMNLAVVSVPTIMYLLTSPSVDHRPFWSHQPMYVPHAPQPSLKNGWVQNIG